jgi:hypothetical protein
VCCVSTVARPLSAEVIGLVYKSAQQLNREQ